MEGYEGIYENKNLSDAERATEKELASEKSYGVNSSEKISIVKEEVAFGKKEVERGRHIFRKEVSEREVPAEVELRSDKFDIQRVPKNEEVDFIPEIRQEGDVTIIPVVKEVPVVVKKLMLVEEIIITKTTEAHTETVNAFVREEEFKHEFIETENNSQNI